MVSGVIYTPVFIIFQFLGAIYRISSSVRAAKDTDFSRWHPTRSQDLNIMSRFRLYSAGHVLPTPFAHLKSHNVGHQISNASLLRHCVL